MDSTLNAPKRNLLYFCTQLYIIFTLSTLLYLIYRPFFQEPPPPLVTCVPSRLCSNSAHTHTHHTHFSHHTTIYTGELSQLYFTNRATKCCVI